jgi:prevent-host-death family protein
VAGTCRETRKDVGLQHHSRVATVTITITSRDFNQDVSRAKRAADDGPVIVTDRGGPAYVLLRYDAYRKLTGKRQNILEMLRQPGVEDIEFDPPRLDKGLFEVPDLS